jgi:hypothetical protein
MKRVVPEEFCETLQNAAVSEHEFGLLDVKSHSVRPALACVLLLMLMFGAQEARGKATRFVPSRFYNEREKYAACKIQKFMRSYLAMQDFRVRA